jgi:hypothetical protein
MSFFDFSEEKSKKDIRSSFYFAAGGGEISPQLPAKNTKNNNKFCFLQKKCKICPPLFRYHKSYRTLDRTRCRRPLSLYPIVSPIR